MKTPERVTVSTFLVDAAAFVDHDCVIQEPERVRCRVCDQPIRTVKTFLSVHIEGFPACTGDGRVIHAWIPYCPQCEPTPNTVGCLHVSPEMAEALRDAAPGVFEIHAPFPGAINILGAPDQ